MNPRADIRQAAVVALLQQGLWKGKVFNARINALSPEDLPAIIVHAKSERLNADGMAQGSFIASLNLVVEIYVRANSTQLNKTDSDTINQLDDMSAAVEFIIYNGLNLTSIGDIYIEEIADISTNIDINNTGEMPYFLATLNFSLSYQKCINADIETCELSNIVTEFYAQQCGDKSLSVTGASHFKS